tara:strand:+ start:268 stop:438 length:171 start_codon:yes stop_codon:yes gene_type:complete
MILTVDRLPKKAAAWSKFNTKKTTIVDTSDILNWDTLSPRKKQTVIQHRKNMLKLT